MFLLDAYSDILVYYSPTTSDTIPFPPPRHCESCIILFVDLPSHYPTNVYLCHYNEIMFAGLLRSTIDKLKQERNKTPKLVFIHGAHDDTTAFEKYLIEDQRLDGYLLTSTTGFSSFLEEISSKVAEVGI
jgi:hypothetical protein